MYDLLLKGGTVVDPSAGLDGVHDIAVEGGQIARIAPDIPSTEAARTIAVRRQGRHARLDRPARPRVRGRQPHRRQSRSRRCPRRRDDHRRRGERGLGDLRRVSPAHHAELPYRDRPLPPHLPDRARHDARHHRGEQHQSGRHAEGARPAQGPHRGHQGAHGLARPRDHGHGDAEAGAAGGARERHAAHGAYRRHGEALRPDGDPEAPAPPRAGRHPHALLHRQSRRRARRQRQARARGARGGGSRRVVRHGARADELQLRRRAAHHRAGAAPALHQHRPHRARDAS